MNPNDLVDRITSGFIIVNKLKKNDIQKYKLDIHIGTYQYHIILTYL